MAGIALLHFQQHSAVAAQFFEIVILALIGAIGINNTLPWRLPADLAHFKALTLWHHIIMGRKTWESLGKPLRGRTSVIVTRDRDYSVPGCMVVHSLEAAMAACDGDTEAFFIGGADLYRQALELADRIYLTEVRTEVAGDAWFPEFDYARWRESSRKHCSADEKNPFDHHFVVYENFNKQGDMAS